MRVIVVKNFKDKTTSKKYEEQELRKVGEIIECDDKLAKKRIELGFVEEYIEEPTEPENENK